MTLRFSGRNADQRQVPIPDQRYVSPLETVSGSTLCKTRLRPMTYLLGFVHEENERSVGRRRRPIERGLEFSIACS